MPIKNVKFGEDVIIPYPPDATQPSGYHCFMSQFLRNIIDNKIPWLTPDFANKCW